MPTYAIGDVQGCYDELQALLKLVDFDPASDQIWLCGDLVNRGPKSLDTLRYVKSLGAAAVSVLGNHDLHLLALAHLPEAKLRRRDTVDDILGAPDSEELLDWLRHQPLFHLDSTLGFAMAHAGVLPSWSVAETQSYAAELASHLADDQRLIAFLNAMYGDQPSHWHEQLTGESRLRVLANCFTRMRYLTKDGGLELEIKDSPTENHPGLQPWFRFKPRITKEFEIVFGHWSTLRLSTEESERYRVWPLDTGVVWGDTLSALRLDDRRWFRVPSLQAKR